MLYSVLLLVVNLLVIAPTEGFAAFSTSPPKLSSSRCEQPALANKDIIVGLHPLRAIVTKVDEVNATIDFISEAGTSLHVTQASRRDLKELRVGDAIELCIVEELHGEEEI